MVAAFVFLVAASVLHWAVRRAGRESMRARVADQSPRPGPIGRIQARRSEAQHDRQLAEELPFALDVAQYALESGHTIAGAVDLVARRGPVSWRPAFAAVGVETQRGATLSEAIDAVSRRRPEFRRWSDLLLASARAGGSVAPLLAGLSVTARADARRAAEARARRLPVLLLFPLVGCVLPAFFCLAIVPSVLGAFERMAH